MAPGADKAISYDPPGAIGLVDASAIVLLRFNETSAAARPTDAAGNLQEMGTQVSAVVSGGELDMPAVVPGSVGRARRFDPYLAFAGLSTRDVDSGATLLTRDMSIQVILSWNAAHQDLDSGSIITRGLGTAGAELIAYGLQIDLVDAPSHTGSVRWLWQDIAGTLHLQTGAQFVNLPGQYTMLTATRRWVSPTEVSLRYYIGDLLIGEVTSVNGSIAGGTTGGTQIGTRIATAAEPFPASDQFFLAANIDELMIVDRELSAEEVEATWMRITLYQPRGTQLFLEMFDPDFPISDEHDSDVQLDIRMTGQGLGFAAAAVENLRANFLPGRSYGSTLAQWEEAVAVTPQPASGLAERRGRVEARMRQRRGVSIPGLGDALVDLLGGATLDDLEFLAFSNAITDGFTALDPLRWDVTPAAGWTVASNAVHASVPAGTYLFDGTTQNWRYAQMTLGGDGKQAHVLSGFAMTTARASLEGGVFVANRGTRDFLLLGLRDDAGTFKIVTESFVSGVSQGVVTQATLGSNPAALWLHLYQTTTDGTWQAAWSTTSGTTGFTISADITHPTVAHWGGLYVRSTAAIAGTGQVDADDFVARMPFSGRANNAYVLLDEALGFNPDGVGARSVIAAIKHAFTHATFITQRIFLNGDPDSGVGLGPLGGY